jgi:hypothetical protein
MLNIFLIIIILFLIINISKVKIDYGFINNKVNITTGFEKKFEREKQTTFSLSKEKNILVFFLDGFSGSELYRLLKYDRILFKNYKGFVNYENIVTTGAETCPSVGAMYGGHNYTVESINSRKNKNVQDEINKAYDIFPKALIPKGWKITYFNPQYATKIDERVNLTKFEYDIYYLGQRQTSILNQYLKKYEINMIYVISIFRAAPIFLKKNIYSKGNWLKVRKKKLSKQHASKTKAYDWGFLNLFEKHINFNSKNKTFKYMQFIIPHAPSGIDKNGNLRENLHIILKVIKLSKKLVKF